MRIPRLLTATALSLVLAAGAHAQDLQYRMVTHMSAPNMPMEMPSPKMSFALKGSTLRMEVDVTMSGAPLTRNVMLIDLKTKSSTIIDDAEKSYSVFSTAALQVSAADSARARAMADSARKALDFKPVMKETGGVRTINGFAARRVLLSMDLSQLPFAKGGPFGDLKEGMKLVTVSEQWVTDDARIVNAYQAFAPMLNQQNEALGLLGVASRGFPLESHIVMVQVPKEAAYDVEAILKAGAKAEGLLMIMDMTAEDIKTGVLDPALFAVPKDYTKK